MQRILRLAFLLTALAALSAGLVACGGDDAAEQDVNTLLTETFSGDKKVESGNLALNIEMNVEGGGQAGVQGPVTLKLGGPFESQGETNLPHFDFDVEFNGGGQSFKAGATSTGEKGFVNWQGTEYAVSDEVFQQFRQGYEEAAKQSSSEQQDQSLANLGLDPRQWLTNARNEGESEVGGTETIKITGGVDVPKLLDDVNKALSRAGELGLQDQAQLPEQLTDEQKQQAAEAVKDVNVEIHTGAEDKILRRMVIAFNVDAPEGGGSVKVDLSMTEVNEGQDISEPENPQPFDQLMSQLGGLSGLLGGGAGAGGGGDAGGGAQPDQQQLQEYTDCVEQAGDDLEAAQQCTELLTP